MTQSNLVKKMHQEWIANQKAKELEQAWLEIYQNANGINYQIDDANSSVSFYASLKKQTFHIWIPSVITLAGISDLGLGYSYFNEVSTIALNCIFGLKIYDFFKATQDYEHKIEYYQDKIKQLKK